MSVAFYPAPKPKVKKTLAEATAILTKVIRTDWVNITDPPASIFLEDLWPLKHAVKNMCSQRSTTQPRYREIRRTIEIITCLLRSDEIDPVTRKQAEEKTRALERELAKLKAQ
jgi:hypothetical protein